MHTPTAAADRRGILLVNLGTPDAPRPGAVWRYLAEFLADRRVVEIPRLVWLPLLYGLILPLRVRRVARAYARIWGQRGSPLRYHSEDLAQALGEAQSAPVACAFRYGTPNIATGLRQLHAAGCDDITIIPLYPQYSSTTTAAIFDSLGTVLQQQRVLPALRFVRDWPTLPGYIAALADSVRQHWAEHGRGEHLLMSFHGLPQRNIDLGDPYQKQCEATGAALAQALDLHDQDWTLSYQSRFGRAQWLQPYTFASLESLASHGRQSVDIICPGFIADCLETLEEIAIGGEEVFRQAGGKTLRYIPALNAAPDLARALAALPGAPAFVTEKN